MSLDSLLLVIEKISAFRASFAIAKHTPLALEIFSYTHQTQTPASLGSLVRTLVRRLFFEEPSKALAAALLRCGAKRKNPFRVILSGELSVSDATIREESPCRPS